MKSQLTLLAMIMTLVILVGCSEQDTIISSHQGILQTVYIDETCVTLFAGQTIDAGTVCVDVNDNQVCITYTTIDGWELTEAHLWMGETKSDMPSTRKGNPVVGHFPNYSGDITGATTHTFYIPIDSLGGEPYICNKNFHVAAHAALRKDLGGGSYQTESAWGDGDRIVERNRGNWATAFTATFLCGGVPPNHITNEDVFAYGEGYATCFLDIPDDGGFFENWGWTNGALTPGTYNFNIYAGAGDCDASNAILVGGLAVDYDGLTGTATITYNITIDFLLLETNLYIGSSNLPTNALDLPTIWPKDYPYHHINLYGSLTDTFTVTGLSGNIYVIGHAVVCGAL
jgi:hypothetical protein